VTCTTQSNPALHRTDADPFLFVSLLTGHPRFFGAWFASASAERGALGGIAQEK
jgi:hypothetical protein